MALAVVIAPGTARIASAHVALGTGRSASSAVECHDTEDRRANLRREVERQRAASRSAIVHAVAELVLHVDGAVLHVSDAFALRTVNAQLAAAGHRPESVKCLVTGAAFPHETDARSSPLPLAEDGRPYGTGAVDALADELTRWIERRYYDDGWKPEDLNQAELTRFLAGMVASHNHELD